MNQLKSMIREVPDFPKAGILFYDITTLLKDAGGLKSVIGKGGEKVGTEETQRTFSGEHFDSGALM